MNSQKYDNDILNEIYKYDTMSEKEKVKFKIFLAESYMLEAYYRIIGRVLNLKNRLVDGTEERQ